jgi:hypothetical protein
VKEVKYTVEAPIIARIKDSAHYKTVAVWVNRNVPALQKKFENIQRLLSLPVTDERFSEAINNLHFIIDKVPLMVTYIEPTHIARARANYGTLFQHEHEISYNSINPELTPAGRFNRPGEGFFYGGLRVDNPETDHLLACSLESCKELIDPDNPPAIQDMTLGRWVVSERFPVVNLCFNETHLSGNKVLREATNDYLAEIESHFNQQAASFIQSFMTFFSDLSCLKDPGNGYYILNALNYAILYYYSETYHVIVPGIIYPSAMSESKGLNIVMVPPAVDHLLVLDKVIMYRFFLVKGTKNYVSYDCSDLVDVVHNKFTIQNYRPIGSTIKINYH